jgi:hypothetical protein
MPGTTRHDWNTVWIRMSPFQEFFLSFAQEPTGLGRGASSRLVKARPQFSSFFVERFPVDRPAQQDLERMTIKSCGL